MIYKYRLPAKWLISFIALSIVFSHFMYDSSWFTSFVYPQNGLLALCIIYRLCFFSPLLNPIFF